MQPPPSRNPTRRLRASGAVSQVMREYYESFLDSDSPVAWCSSMGPVELLLALGYKVFFPENHAAVIAARRLANEYVRHAHSLGFSRDSCGYLNADIGVCAAGKSPLSDIHADLKVPPSPNIVVYNTNQCRDIKEWFLFHAQRLDVPCVGIESPMNVGQLTPSIVNGVVGQIRDLMPVLSQNAKRKLDIDKLKEVIRLSRRCSELWRKILETSCARPAPLLFDTALILMGPTVVLRGTMTAVTIYEQVLKELNQRCDLGIGGQKLEKHRIYFDGMPIWGRLREIDRIQKSLGIATVASTYCNSWIFDALDPDHPFESMARAYLELFIARSESEKLKYLQSMAEKFHIDGFVFHEAKTCPSNSNSRYGLPLKLQQSLRIPVTTIFGDHVDPTLFDSERFTVQIEAFAEQLEHGQ